MSTTSSSQIKILFLSIALLLLAGNVFARQAQSATSYADVYATEEVGSHADKYTNGLPADNAETQEPCSIRLHSAYNLLFRGAYSRGYSAENQATHSERLPFSIKHTGGECEYKVTIRPVNGKFELSSGNDNLNYQLSLYSSGNQQQGGLVSLRGSFAEGYGDHYDDLMLTIPGQQQVTAGIYSSNLSVLVYQLESHREILVSSQNISLSTFVAPFVKASFGNGKTTAIVNLGNLRSRKEVSLQMNIDANTSYSVYVSSANKGNLNHSLSNILIPYSFFIGSEQASLAGASYKVLSGQQKITSETVPVRINYTPGSETLLAGQYEDRIEIRIVAD